MKTSTSLIAAAAFALAAACPVAARADIILVENFNHTGTPLNWVQTNNSVQAGQPWFHGNPGVFAAQAGAPDAYIAANYLSALNGAGTIDNWLITPELTLSGPTVLSFYTRSPGTPGFNDTMEVRFSSGGGSATSGFTALLATIGGAAAYPSSWQQFSASVSASGSGRFAFRYTGNADIANYIGLDTVSVSAVPEPAAWLLLGLGLAALVPLRRVRGRAALALLLAGAAAALPAAAQEGMVVVRDAQSGQLRAATPAEIKALHEQNKALHPAKPVQEQAVRRQDGTLRKRLGESGMVFEVITRDADGKLVTQCVNGEQAAEAAVKHVSPAAHRNEEPYHD
jgi:hypothetical protein